MSEEGGRAQKPVWEIVLLGLLAVLSVSVGISGFFRTVRNISQNIEEQQKYEDYLRPHEETQKR